MRAALYARVSTEEQVEGYSIDAQRRAFHWIKGKHETFISPELFDAAQQSRKHNTSNAAKTIRSDAQPCSLSGVARCAECGATLRVLHAHGHIRLACSTRLEDYQEKILETHQKLQSVYSDTDEQRAKIKAALRRLKDLYQWGHKSKEEYLAEYNSLRQELEVPEPTSGAQNLDKLAQFLKNVALAWKEAKSGAT